MGWKSYAHNANLSDSITQRGWRSYAHNANLSDSITCMCNTCAWCMRIYIKHVVVLLCIGEVMTVYCTCDGLPTGVGSGMMPKISTNCMAPCTGQTSIVRLTPAQIFYHISVRGTRVKRRAGESVIKPDLAFEDPALRKFVTRQNKSRHETVTHHVASSKHVSSRY